MYLILIIILFIIYFLIPNQEYYQDVNLYPTRILNMPKYVRINKNNTIDAVYLQPPTPQANESRCDVVQCPSWIPENTICYSCF